jgi:uncharacterized protein (DUF1778 family)
MTTQQPKQNKTRTIAFRVTDDQFAHLISFVDAEGYRSVSQFMYQLVKDEIDDRLDLNDVE